MVNNYDRIFVEIEKRVAREAPEGLATSVLVDLILEVVYLEDQKTARIKQKVESKIRAVAVTELSETDDSQAASSESGCEPAGAAAEES